MKKFKCEFEMENAAFDDGDGSVGPELETLRIVNDIGHKVFNGQTDDKILDKNGNMIGAWSIEE